MFHRTTILGLAALISIASGACSVGVDDVASAASELQSLQPEEIVGSIAFGEAKTIAYAPMPRLRALAFTGRRGNEAYIEVSAEDVGAIPKVSLLMSDFAVLAGDNDGFGVIRQVLPADGTYYIALREEFDGVSYLLSETPRYFDQIPLPVTVRGTSNATLESTVSLRRVVYVLTKTRPQTLRGKFDAAEPLVIGKEMPGVTLEIVASTKFYENFTNGSACARLRLHDRKGNSAFVEEGRPIRLVTPITLEGAPTCAANRASTPQEPTADFEVLLDARLVKPPPPAP